MTACLSQAAAYGMFLSCIFDFLPPTEQVRKGFALRPPQKQSVKGCCWHGADHGKLQKELQEKTLLLVDALVKTGYGQVRDSDEVYLRHIDAF